MAFNAYLLFSTAPKEICGESSSTPAGAPTPNNSIEVQDYGFGASMPVTTSRSDGGGATVGRANFDVFTATKGIDTATTDLFKYCCKGTDIPAIILHLYRAGTGSEASGTTKYAIVVFQHCVVTKVAISGSGEELPKESMEFNYGLCEYQYQLTDHSTGAISGAPKKYGWSTVKNAEATGLQGDFNAWAPDAPK